MHYRGYQTEDGSAILPVNTAVQGDVTIIVYHARSTFGGKVQGKVCLIQLSSLLIKFWSQIDLMKSINGYTAKILIILLMVIL